MDFGRELDGEHGGTSCWRREVHGAVEGAHARRDAVETTAARTLRTADAVVVHDDAQRVVVRADVDRRRLRLRMLQHVADRLGHYEVRGLFDGARGLNRDVDM